jgi:hypothetical protein
VGLRRFHPHWGNKRKHRDKYAGKQAQPHFEKNEEGVLHPDHPMARAVNRAFNTGEVVSWEAGEPLPEPGGPEKPVHDPGA